MTATLATGLPESEYQALRDSIFDAIWSELDPLETRIEDEERVPYDIVLPVLERIGAFGLLVPREYGGSGLSITQYLPIIAEFAKVQGGLRTIVHVHNSFAHALFEIGNDQQRMDILPGAATGKNSLAFALTEPGHGTGSDLGSMAVRDGGGYVLSGEKWLITNSDIASHFIVFAKTTETEVSAFIVPRDAAGLSIAPLPETMGCKGTEHGRLTFDSVRVPAEALVGAEGQGNEHLERALEISRVFIAASSLGTSERALELSIAHAKDRVTFGKPIGARQGIQRYLAEMATDIYALRGILADAAQKWDAGQRIPAEASMCKLFGLEAVGRVTDRALLIHGGIGYTRTHPIERLYRDARLNWLEEGTPTIQYHVTAGQLLNDYAFADAFGTASRN
ncbi:alkylation response protein AidB-like acyl-CoA dehydrogenase [Williamsia limnetica]|uniref:Alkylation response protein AidB-like acyl-CoA dehydrogenase n=1 Tax=Williamsia limnetica TaxID=882452 RepID=A0A318RDB9_WILLI|nr:acyl-CoA dehydrogenase family protein [Williamsia limnetica]PYE11866.1 alkylation response protein AidB-like acyl-CoA dehydrogenase [Williamsia limnetica]